MKFHSWLKGRKSLILPKAIRICKISRTCVKLGEKGVPIIRLFRGSPKTNFETVSSSCRAAAMLQKLKSSQEFTLQTDSEIGFKRKPALGRTKQRILNVLH